MIGKLKALLLVRTIRVRVGRLRLFYYVRGSHPTKPAKLWRDGRISDEEMAAEYEKADLVEICGEAGTILAVDTVGFHKGKALTKNECLLLQFEFANSLFGANYPRQQVAPDSRLGEATRKHQPRYGLLTVK